MQTTTLLRLNAIKFAFDLKNNITYRKLENTTKPCYNIRIENLIEEKLMRM